MKDLRRWGTALITLALITSMATSIAFSASTGSRGGSDRPSDGADDPPVIDALGDPQDGNGGGKSQPALEPDLSLTQYFWVSLKMLMFGRVLPSVSTSSAHPTSRAIRR